MRTMGLLAALMVCGALAGCGQPQGGSVIDAIEQQEAARTADLEAAKKKGADFLAENAKRPEVKTTESGLQYEIVRTSANAGLPNPAATDEVTVHYEGKLIDGRVFDSSYARGEPARFRLNQVIAGWTEGLQLMRPGDEFRFYIPADLAYGANAPPDIGPNQALIFRVELLALTDAAGKTVTAPK